MSDGPYRSLPMPRCWKRLAEFSENENFGDADTRSVAITALEKTCRSALPAELIDGLRGVFLEKQGSLFADLHPEAVEALRPLASGHGVGRLLLDHALGVAREGGCGEDGLTEATERMLSAIGAAHTLQIEEHYLRKAPASLTRRVVIRAEQALATADKRALARRLCRFETTKSRRASLKRSDIDDGVPL